MFEDSKVEPFDELIHDCRRLWRRLGETGDFWSARDRFALAAEVRRARVLDAGGKPAGSGSPGGLPEAAVEAVHRITLAPASPNREWIADLMARGLSEGRIVELPGVVGVTLVVDTTATGVGAKLPDFPVPEDGEPAGVYPDGAVIELPEMFIRTVPPHAAVGSLKDVYRITFGTQAMHDERAGEFYPVSARSLSLSPKAEWDVWYASEYYTRRKWTSLTQQQFDLLGVATSSYNSCLFCGSVYAISQMQHDPGVDLVCALDDDTQRDTGVPEGALLLRFSAALLRQTPDLADARRALAAAIDDTAVWEAAFQVGATHLANRQNDVSGVALEEQFRPLVPAGVTEYLDSKSRAAKRS